MRMACVMLLHVGVLLCVYESYTCECKVYISVEMQSTGKETETKWRGGTEMNNKDVRVREMKWTEGVFDFDSYLSYITYP